MRPVNKLQPGDSVILEDGSTHVILDQYIPYQDAKDPLCANIGKYCSYCENPVCNIRGLDVEHVLPKDPALKYTHLQYKWDNFLIACPTCNGADNKGIKVAQTTDCHYPHINNTFLSLKYNKGGVVVVNDKLTGLSLKKAQALMDLVRLDKTPVTSNPKDKRWLYRSQQWDLAERFRDRYQAKRIDLDCLIDAIKAFGYWSIWFTVFDGIDEVRQRLISDFPGTAAQCFDPGNHYNPIERNPGEPDPV